MKFRSFITLFSLILSAATFSKVPILTVYTYDSFAADWGPAPKLIPAFEEQCQCKLKFMPFEDGLTMFNRIRLEGKKTKADVMLGLDNFTLPEAQKTDLFVAHSLTAENLNLPQKWEDQVFYPYDFGEYAFIYNNQKLSNPPESLKELVDRQELKVIYQDPRTSTVGRGLLMWMNAVFGEQTQQAWEKLAKHTVTIGKGWSETYGAFLKGEADLVLSYSTSPLYHYWNEKTDAYSAANFTEGHLSQIEVAAILRTAKQPELARQFLTFLHSPKAQQIIATHNIMKPVIKAEIDPAFAKLPEYKNIAITMPNQDVIRQWLAQWQSAVSK